MTESLTIALSKGRILDDTLPLLASAGIEPLVDPRKSRKLIFDTNQSNIKLVIIRAADVPTFVEFGAADLGVAGKDVLMEYDGDLFELLDLGIARCRLMVAEPADIAANDDPANWSRLRIATKYVKIARHFFAAKGYSDRDHQAVRLDGTRAFSWSGRSHRRPGRHRKHIAC